VLLLAVLVRSMHMQQAWSEHVRLLVVMFSSQLSAACLKIRHCLNTVNRSSYGCRKAQRQHAWMSLFW